MIDKTLYPDCTEGPFAIPMKDAVAKQVEALLKEYQATRGDAVLKLAGSAEVTVENDRAEVSKITTEAVDRDKEIVVAKGIDLTAYNQNPVVLLNHDWTGLPLGKAEWVKRSSGENPGLTAKTRYAKRPGDHQGEWIPDSVYALISQKMLPGKSIGFLPLISRAPEKADIAARPQLKDVRRIHEKSVLLEYSVVSIPSNPEALVETLSKSYPALAALLPELVFAPKDDEPTLKNLMGILKEIQAQNAAVDHAGTMDRLKSLEENHEAFKYAIKDIRRLAIGAGGKEPIQPSQQNSKRLLSKVAAELDKLIGRG